MVRLKKIDVEQLTDTFDDDPVAALTVALRRIIERPTAEWTEIVAALSIGEPRKKALIARDTRAMEDLFRDLIELRDVPPPDTGRSGH